MPHLVILYSGNLEAAVDMSALCHELACAMYKVHDDQGRAVFPVGGIRVLAYPAAHHAVADNGATARSRGEPDDYGFVYLNLRMGAGRSVEIVRAAGEAIAAVARERLATLMDGRRVGMTFQIDIGQQAFDARFGNLHAMFQQGGKAC